VIASESGYDNANLNAVTEILTQGFQCWLNVGVIRYENQLLRLALAGITVGLKYNVHVGLFFFETPDFNPIIFVRRFLVNRQIGPLKAVEAFDHGYFVRVKKL
jgi:hypothetical protein